MKHLLRSVLIVFAAISIGFGQNKLTNSRESGYYTYIYQLTDKEAFSIASEGNKVINDGFMHSLVDSFYHVTMPNGLEKRFKKLAFGNYLVVKAVKNELEYQLKPKNNVVLQFINNNKDFQFTVTDLKGDALPNASVTIGKGKRVRHNHKAGLYIASSGARLKVITVLYNGISNYFTYEEEERYKPQPRAKNSRRLAKMNPMEESDGTVELKKKLYSGYLVFNKPMYKPLDTVKFKAYLLTTKGKLIQNKTLKVELQKEWNKPGLVLGSLNPYRDGGYTYSFELSDSLQLKLDRNYAIVLKEQVKSEWLEVYRNSFRYDDYELKSVNFSVRSDKDKHSPGSPVSLFLKAIDENELAVPDGRVEVVVKSDQISEFYDQQVFVKDTLWKTNVMLDPVGETKLVLPDSIFPKADMNFSVNFTFLNSNNERKTAYKSLRYTVDNQVVRSEFKKDSLHLDYLVKGKSVRQKAMVKISYPNTDVEDSLSVELPAAIKMNYQASDYAIKMADGYIDYVFMDDLKPELSVAAAQTKDSLRIVVNNPQRIPFWYTVFSGSKVFTRGYASQLDTLIKHNGSRAAEVKLNYIWDEKERSTEATAFFRPNVLNVKLLAPDLVYPGQTVNMQVKVTDVNDKPVGGTDVTAYAYTAKFKNGYAPGIPYFGRGYTARKLSPELEAELIGLSGKMKLDWEKWSKELNLDTIEYYKFTQTKDLYITTEATDEKNVAVIAPFVVSGGTIEPIHILYIDEVPVFFSQANQLQRYAFKILPGTHSIRMRTANHVVDLRNYEFEKGKKTILSVATDAPHNKASVHPVAAELDKSEAATLSNYVFRVENNFNGQKAVLVTDSNTYLLNLPGAGSTGNVNYDQVYRNGLQRPTADNSLLVGPFIENYLTVKSAGLQQTFIRESGYTYTFLPGLLKQKSYNTLFGFNTNLSSASGSSDYKQQPLKRAEIDSLWNEYLDLRSSTTSLFNNWGVNYGKDFGQLRMKVDTAISKKMSYLKNILIYKYDEPDFLMIYPGNASSFTRLEKGKYKMIYLFKDNRYFVAEAVDIKPNGVNYFEWKRVKIQQADSLSTKIDLQIKSVNLDRKSNSANEAQLSILYNINNKFFDKSTLSSTMTGRVIDAADKTPIHGVMIKVKGTDYGVVTASDGRFEIKVPKRGGLIFSYIGYDTKEVPVVNGNVGDVKLDASIAALEEVVVVGYGAQKKSNVTGSISSFVGASDKVVLRGIHTTSMDSFSKEMLIRSVREIGALGSTAPAPMIIVDGLSYNGDVSNLDPVTIANMNVLKGDEAIAIYGLKAAGGVIIIKTKGGNTALNAAGEPTQMQQTMRTNFSDYAIWQPELFTDADGKAAFTVEFPDDITNWTTHLIAMNGRKQGGVGQTNIKSFKTLSANFVSPSFALVGDSIRVIGKLMNYNNMEETVSRKFSYNGSELLNGRVSFKNAKIDTMAIVARGLKLSQTPANVTDSLSFEYTMKQDNGYFDGEVRKIPLLQAGVIETKGFFNAFTRDTTINYNFDPALGKVTLRAEASLFPTLLEEMEKLRNYEYLCNEQMASKLKALLLEKTVRKYLGQDFKEEKNIKVLLKKLQTNRLPQGTWGWWQNSSEEIWISLHVVETLLQAQKQGYEVLLDKDRLRRYLLDKMISNTSFDQIYGIRMLKALDEKYELKDWIVAIEKQRATLEAQNAKDRKANNKIPLLPEQPMYEKLQLMQLKQNAGMPVDMKWLLDHKNETMFGNSYWGQEVRYFWNNSIQNTLLAYQILKTNGGYRDELDRIQRYFLEQRKDGQWRNTYESSLILQTILPELMTTPGKKPEPASITLQKTENITAFPFNRVMEPNALTLSKKGDAPVYFTAYQQFNNPKPEKVSKDFTVKTVFEQNGEAVVRLKAGNLTNLKVEVDVRADADYVMIEIPIPAGCSYENKMQSFWGVETHREYFKHKTSIFCTHLKKGKYSFNISLMPRYSGSYTLNPAKAEMMYFPVFYGREGIKRITVN
uniref:alpha-2-macroglobulin family protein n=1 Tax=Pedobacter schmidteae TaxID=2201271 RepID=UPI000EB2B9EE|nr:carboxypeptidase-like regulatory domain-containing protein [Pedobacter schmidteae]